MPDIVYPKYMISDFLPKKDTIVTREEFIESLSDPQSAYIFGLRVQSVDSASYWFNKYKETEEKEYLEKMNKYLIQAETLQFLIDLDLYFEEYEDMKKEYNKIIKEAK